MDKTGTPTFGGIDWATDEHAVCVVDDTGAVVDEFVVTHTAAGLKRLCTKLRVHGVRRVAIERPDGRACLMDCVSGWVLT